jgi:hypothetical protein
MRSTTHQFLFCGATIVAVVFLGCSKGVPAQPGVADQATGKSDVSVDECGRYEFKDKLPSGVCASDDDCAWTSHRPGTCTDALCKGHYRAGTKAWVKAADEMYERVCSGKKWLPCVRVKCRNSKPVGVSCVDGICVPVF